MKTLNKVCATNENSDEPAHPCSLIRVVADRMCFLQPSGYPMKDNNNPCHTRRIYKLICVFASHTGLIVSFVVRYPILFGDIHLIQYFINVYSFTGNVA